LRRLNRPTAAPKTLLNLKMAADLHAQQQFNRGVKSISFRGHVFGADDVRAELDTFHHGKCAYCEAPLRPVTNGHIEHFRPKGGIVDEGTGALVTPGYYWLAYSWENLLLACPRCNSAGNKGNRFPLQDEAGRASPAAKSTAREQPLLVDPAGDYPRRHVRFRREVVYAVQGSAKGQATIKVLGLEDPFLQEARREHLEIMKMCEIVSGWAANPAAAAEATLHLAQMRSSAGAFLACAKDSFYLRVRA